MMYSNIGLSFRWTLPLTYSKSGGYLFKCLLTKYIHTCYMIIRRLHNACIKPTINILHCIALSCTYLKEIYLKISPLNRNVCHQNSTTYATLSMSIAELQEVETQVPTSKDQMLQSVNGYTEFKFTESIKTIVHPCII